MAKEYTVDLSIHGGVSPDVAKSVGLSMRELGKLNSYIGGMNKLMQKSALTMNGIVAPTKKLEEQMEKANNPARGLSDSFKRIGEIAAGVFSGEAFLGALEKGLDLVKEMGEKIGEFGIGALEKQAAREVLQNQMHAMLSSMGRAGMAGPLADMMRNMEGVETSQNFNQLMGTSTRLLSASPDRFKNVESVHHVLAQLADVSKDSATYDLATASITKMLAEGRVDQQHLREFAVDTGYNLTRPMAEALGMTPEALSEALKKHTISGDKQIDALLKALDIITGPGGPAFGHAEAQLSGLEALYRRFLADWTEFQTSFGSTLEDFIKPLASDILDLFKPSELIHTFDWLKGTMSDLGEDAKALFDAVKGMNFGSAFDYIQKQTSKIQGFFDSFFVEVEDPVKGLHKVLKPDVLQRLNEEMQKFRELSERTADAIKTATDRLEPLITAIQKLASIVQFLTGWIDDWIFGGKMPDWLKNLPKNPAGGDWSGYGDAYEKAYENGGYHMRSVIPEGSSNSVNGAKGSTEGFTEYGPIIDPKGSRYYDSDSYNGIGHIHGVRYDLNSAGYTPIAMYPEHAARWYPGLRPGGVFRSRYDGKLHRWMDTTGSRNPDNEDVYDGEKTVNVTYNIQALDTQGIETVLNSHGDRIERHLSRWRREERERSAVV